MGSGWPIKAPMTCTQAFQTRFLTGSSPPREDVITEKLTFDNILTSGMENGAGVRENSRDGLFKKS